MNENINLTQIFPELKESDDEKIRRWIIDVIIYNMINEPLNNSEYKKKAEKAIAWLEKQGERNLPSANERAWLYLVSDVLTWKDGIGQYLDDPRVQELAKRLCSEYAHKLYNPSSDKIEPRFKVGDRVRHKETNKDDVYEISKVYDDSYGIDGFTWMIYMKYQDQYELVPNKFDPKTLKQFDRVLVRDTKKEKWNIEVFSYIDEDSVLSYVTPTSSYIYCIPYNDETKHLVGTKEEAPEYYRY